MDAIILAAGLGTRLRPHTLTTPKPLLPVQGKPILEWTLRALPKNVDRVILVTHYLAEQFDDFMAHQDLFKEYVTVPQGEPQGTGDALRKCQQHVRSDHFMVLNGDDLYGTKDLEALSNCPAGLLVRTVTEPKKFGIVFMKLDATLDKLVEKPDLEGEHLANIGAYVFPKTVFNIELQLSPRGEYEITDYVSQLARTMPFRVVQANYWFPIGTEEAWHAAEKENLQKHMLHNL